MRLAGWLPSRLNQMTSLRKKLRDPLHSKSRGAKKHQCLEPRPDDSKEKGLGCDV